LSITAHLLEVLGQIAASYDIGCKFAKMVKAHPVLGKLAADKKFLALVGAFHGHGHARIFALYNLMTYVKGVGLEALEGCESFFSKSNALASTTRYASRFHRQQSITTYLKHADAFDAYHGLCEYVLMIHFNDLTQCSFLALQQVPACAGNQSDAQCPARRYAGPRRRVP
jgi:hypothetical protein